MDTVRKPFQGVWNIVRFNWHYYVLSLLVIIAGLLFSNRLDDTLRILTDIFLLLIIVTNLVSLAISYYIYDLAGLYKMNWLDNLKFSEKEKIININAGFDETSYLLKDKFPNSGLKVFDFYDPVKHTEISIKRARQAYPPYPNTQQITTNSLPVESNSTDKVFILIAAHEIRNNEERISFLKELNRILKASGQIIVTEHLRNTPNVLAYNIGVFHFHSKKTWLTTFENAGLKVVREIKITSFITTFILEKNGTAS